MWQWQNVDARVLSLSTFRFTLTHHPLSLFPSLFLSLSPRQQLSIVMFLYFSQLVSPNPLAIREKGEGGGKLIESTFSIEVDDLREKHVTCMEERTTKVMQDMPRKSTLIESGLKNWVWVTGFGASNNSSYFEKYCKNLSFSKQLPSLIGNFWKILPTFSRMYFQSSWGIFIFVKCNFTFKMKNKIN